jgi:NAD(P)-dependent dehydrogenase (short-subunit alcohol dehydrogenase family)
LDVTDRPEIKKVVAEIISRFGRIDIWVNNAGISTMTPFLELTEQEWDSCTVSMEAGYSLLPGSR